MIDTTILETCFLKSIGKHGKKYVLQHYLTLDFIIHQLEEWCGKQNGAWFDINYHDTSKSYDVRIAGDAIPEPKAEASSPNLKTALMRAVILAERMIHPK